ncbi:hypothetical protein Bca4012_010472 [Brassica carinata]|uniref:Uncharacterized protein n=1 Tax=Brassica carinata TaxID=52824 RepID=A0A8X7S594_BRACI|nr:hypothetical protein Bca52824_035387 [Brassica carinata]
MKGGRLSSAAPPLGPPRAAKLWLATESAASVSYVEYVQSLSRIEIRFVLFVMGSVIAVCARIIKSCLSFEAAHLNGLGIAGSAQFKSGLTTGSRLRSAVTTASLFVIEPEPPLLRLSPSASPPFPLTPVTPPRHGSVRKPYISLDLSFLCVVMDLRFSSGLGKSDGSRYGNIRVLFLSWISVCVPLWIRVKSIVSSRRRLYYTPDIEAALSHQGFYGAKLHRLNLSLLVTAGSIVQECCFARFSYDYLTVASLSHYDVSSIDGSSQSRICGIPDLLVAGTIVKKCGLARITYNYITAVTPSHYAVSSIDSSSQSQLCNLQTGVVARRPYHPEAFYLLSNVCSYTFRLNECNDCMLRFPLVINYWARHGNVEFRGLDPIKQSAMSSNSILSVSLEVKLELEIHLVSSASLVGFKADCACFSIISNDVSPSCFDPESIKTHVGEIVQKVEFMAHPVDPKEAAEWWRATCDLKPPPHESWSTPRIACDRIDGCTSFSCPAHLKAIRRFCHVADSVEFRSGRGRDCRCSHG